VVNYLRLITRRIRISEASPKWDILCVECKIKAVAQQGRSPPHAVGYKPGLNQSSISDSTMHWTKLDGHTYLKSCHCFVHCTLVLRIFFILWQINSLCLSEQLVQWFGRQWKCRSAGAMAEDSYVINSDVHVASRTTWGVRQKLFTHAIRTRWADKFHTLEGVDDSSNRLGGGPAAKRKRRVYAAGTCRRRVRRSCTTCCPV